MSPRSRRPSPRKRINTCSACVGDASKDEVKHAVELMFEVKVEGVNLLNKPGKSRRFKNVAGKRNGYKKAYVRLQTGQSIDFTGAAK